ncbi:MAG: tetratricopeptide repeat protein [Chlorobiaceae bacterium]|nr:tetratricopeptide repeat protein [Chlorobiaceae bacterium]
MHSNPDGGRGVRTAGSPGGSLSGIILSVLLGMGVSGCASSVPTSTPAKLPETRAALQDSSMKSFSRGSFLMIGGKYWEAIESYQRAMTGRPAEDAAVHFAISKAYFSLSVPDSARVHGEDAVRLDPSNIYYSIYLARLVHEMQDYSRSAELYGTAVLAAPERSDIMYAQALEFVAANKPTEALEVFNRLLDRDPSDERYLSQSLWLQIALKRYDDAIVTLKRLIDQVGPREKLQLTLGELYEETGQGEKALGIYRQIIGRDSNSAAAWAAMIDHYVGSGSIDEAVREFRGFDDRQHGDSSMSIEMTKLFAIRAEKDSAYVLPVFRMLDVLVERHGKDSRVHVLKGTYEMRRNAETSAIASFDKAIRLDSRNADAWESLVMALLDSGDHRRAFNVVMRARHHLPHQKFRFDVLQGYALLKAGSPAKSATVLERVVRSKQEPDKHELLIQANSTLAMAYDVLGKKQLSIEAYTRVLQLDPHNALAMNNLAYLYSEQKIQLQKALRLAQNAVMLDPENPVFLDTLGWVNYRLGNFTVARDLLEKAVSTGIEETEIFSHLGSVYEKLGDAVKAKEMFEKAKTVGKKP